MDLDLEIWTKLLMLSLKRKQIIGIFIWRHGARLAKYLQTVEEQSNAIFVQYLYQKLRNHTSINKIRHLLWAVI